MSSTYIVQSGDVLGKIFQQAHNDDKDLTWKEFLDANPTVKKNPDKIFIGDSINIPNVKKSSSSTSADPKEGKCGNEFTFHPRGKASSAIEVNCSVNGKKSPTLEADKTYINEQEKPEDSQSGTVEITINGKTTVLVEDLEVLKKKITKHKDIKIDITMFDNDVLIPAQLPEFRSLDNHVTMTPTEIYTSQSNKQNILESFGFTSETTETGVIIEASVKNAIMNTVQNIEEVDWKIQRDIVYGILSSFQFDGIYLPVTLATKDLLTGAERKILQDVITGLMSGEWNGKFKVSSAKTGGQLITFMGWSGARGYLNMTRIKASNAKIGSLGLAVAASGGSGKAYAEATGILGQGSKFNVLIVASAEVLEWLLSEDPMHNLSDLFIGMTTTLVKFAIAGVGGAAVAAAIVFFSTEIAAGIVVFIVIAGPVIIGIGLEWFDSSLGITQSLKDGWNKIEEKLVAKPSDYHASGVPNWLLH